MGLTLEAHLPVFGHGNSRILIPPKRFFFLHIHPIDFYRDPILLFWGDLTFFTIILGSG